MDIQQQIDQLNIQIQDLQKNKVWDGMNIDTRANINDCVIDAVNETSSQATFIYKGKLYMFPLLATTGSLTVSSLIVTGAATIGAGINLTGTLSITNGGIQVGSKGSAYRIGWITGAGGAVTQLTNRSTGVTIDAYTGQITTRNDSLAAGASATFTVSNAFCGTNYVPMLAVQSQGTTNTSIPLITAVTGTGFDITMYNRSAATADTGASIINFVLMAGANS